MNFGVVLTLTRKLEFVLKIHLSLTWVIQKNLKDGEWADKIGGKGAYNCSQLGHTPQHCRKHLCICVILFFQLYSHHKKQFSGFEVLVVTFFPPELHQGLVKHLNIKYTWDDYCICLMFPSEGFINWLSPPFTVQHVCWRLVGVELQMAGEPSGIRCGLFGAAALASLHSSSVTQVFVWAVKFLRNLITRCENDGETKQGSKSL